MAKIKKESITNENKKNLFYYEIIGIILTFLSFFALAKLGSFGAYLNLIIKLLFGDWAFLLIMLGILSGCYFLMVHEHLPISSLRVIGIFFVFLSLVVLSHFSMHNYISQYSTDYFSLTISLYIDYFKNGNSDSIVGGGIVGMCFFYLFYYLLSTPGVIIISIMMILLGVSFVSRKTMMEFVRLFVICFKKFVKLVITIKNKLKGTIKNMNSEYGKSIKKKLPRNFVIKKEISIIDTSNQGENIAREIKIILNELNVLLYNVSYYLTPHLIVVEIKCYLKINLIELENKITRKLGIPFLLKINEDDNIIYVEILNPNINRIPLYEIINKYCKDGMFLAVNDHLNIEYLNNESKSVLMFNKNILMFELYIVIGLVLKKEIYILDFNEELSLYKDYVDNYYFEPNDINKFLVEIENKENNDCIVYINLCHDVLKDKDLINKIKYMIEISKDKDILILVRLEKYFNFNNYFYDVFGYIMTLDVDNKDVLKLFGFNHSIGLAIGSEGLLKYQDIVMRVALGELSIEERKKLEQS